MISNKKYATNYTLLLFAVLLLISLIPDDAVPLWGQVIIGISLGSVSRTALLARLDAQSKAQPKQRVQ